MYFHGARFSNYEAWLSDPTHIGPSAQVVWPIVGQEILNGDMGGGFQGIQIIFGVFQMWWASRITNELQLYCTAIGALVFAALMLFASSLLNVPLMVGKRVWTLFLMSGIWSMGLPVHLWRRLVYKGEKFELSCELNWNLGYDGVVSEL